MTPPESRIYLASRSPRRQELLKQIGVNFEVLSLREASPRRPDIDETPLANEAPPDYVRRIARAKAEAGLLWARERQLPYHLVLGADTAVVLKDKIFGKPENPDHAQEMLLVLSGQRHAVLTAIAVAAKEATQVQASISHVRFRNISKHEISRYIACGEGLDKAGGYAIQGAAAVFISRISGSYSGIVGLPLFETARLLEEFGIKIFQ